MASNTETLKNQKIAGIYIRVSTEDQAKERLFFRRTTRKIRTAM